MNSPSTALSRILAFAALAVIGMNPAVSGGAAHTFGVDIQVSHSTGSAVTSSEGRSIVVRGDRVFVCWEDRRDVYPAIYFARSADGGHTFSPEIRVNESGSGEFPSLAADASGDRVYITWDGARFGPTDFGLYFDRSVDGGATFGVDRYLAGTCAQPFQGGRFMATDGGPLILLVGSTYDSVFVMRSTTSGDVGAAGAPSVAIGSHGDAFIVWTQNDAVFFDRGVLDATTSVRDQHAVDLPGIRTSPNPSSSTFELTWIAGTPAGPLVSMIDVFDAAGGRIRSIAGERRDDGVVHAGWDGLDGRGNRAPAGIYFARLRGRDVPTARMVLTR